MSTKKIKCGLVGLGAWGLRILDKIWQNNRFEVVQTVTKTKKYSGNLIPHSTNYKDITCNPDIDLVYIATPPQVHKQIIEDCIYNDKNLIVEKPLFDNLKDLEEINSLLRRWKHNKLFLVNYIHLFNKTFTDWVDEVVSTKKKGTFYINIRGPIIRDYISVKLDYGSHAVSIMYYLMEKLNQRKLEERGCGHFASENFGFCVKYDTVNHKDVSVTFCDEVGETLTWRDGDKPFDSLQNLFNITVKNIDKSFSNFDLAYKVGKILLC